MVGLIVFVALELLREQFWSSEIWRVTSNSSFTKVDAPIAIKPTYSNNSLELNNFLLPRLIGEITFNFGFDRKKFGTMRYNYLEEGCWRRCNTEEFDSGQMESQTSYTFFSF